MNAATHPSILAEKTFGLFGYFPSSLSPHSKKPVIVVCGDCKKERSAQMSNVTRAKSFRCQNCSRPDRLSLARQILKQKATERTLTGEKECSRCKETKPLNTKNFRLRKARGNGGDPR